MLKFKILIIFCLSCNTVFAQKLVFKVIAAAGNSKIEKQLLNVGMDLFDNQQIVIAQNGYIGLIHISGRTLELAKVGIYKIKELEELLMNSENQHLMIFYDYLKSIKSRSLGGRGATEREYISIHFYQPYKIKLYKTNQVTIVWHKMGDVDTYQLKIFNLLDDVINTLTIKDTIYQFDLEKPEYQEDVIFYIKVIPVNKQIPFAQKVIIEKYDIDEQETKKDAAKYQIFEKKNQQYSSIHFQKINRAIFFEEDGYLMEAMNLYKELMLQNPSIEVFEVAFYHFCTRHQVYGELLALR